MSKYGLLQINKTQEEEQREAQEKIQGQIEKEQQEPQRRGAARGQGMLGGTEQAASQEKEKAQEEK